MNWKRTKASYVFLVLFALFECFAIYYFSAEFCIRSGIQDCYKWVFCLGVLLLGGLFSVFPYMAKKKWDLHFSGNKILWYVVEVILGLSVLTIGILMRIKRLPFEESSAIFEIVKMKYKTPFPKTFFGAEDLYLQILHGFCYVLGNVTYFMVRFHLVLCVLAGIPWYFGIRKLAGIIPAMTFAFFYYLTPGICAKAAILSSEPMAFLICGIGFFLLGCFLDAGRKNWIAMAFLCAAIGICGYFDLIGFILIAFVISIWHLQVENKNEELKEYLKIGGAALGGATVGFFLCVAIKALISGLSIGRVLSGWFDRYCTKTILNLGFLTNLKSSIRDVCGSNFSLILAVIGVITIVLFILQKRKIDKISPWIGIIVATTLFTSDGGLMILTCMFTISGIGLEDLFAKVESVEEKQEAKATERIESKPEVKQIKESEAKPEEKKPMETEAKPEEKKSMETEAKQEEKKPEEAESKPEEKKPEEAEAKQEEKKLAVTEAEAEEKKPEETETKSEEKLDEVKLEYDYEVSDDDDFDIK